MFFSLDKVYHILVLFFGIVVNLKDATRVINKVVAEMLIRINGILFLEVSLMINW